MAEARFEPKSSRYFKCNSNTLPSKNNIKVKVIKVTLVKNFRDLEMLSNNE